MGIQLQQVRQKKRATRQAVLNSTSLKFFVTVVHTASNHSNRYYLETCLNHLGQHLNIIEDGQPETRNSFRLLSLLSSSLGFGLLVLHLGLFLDAFSQFLLLLVLVFTGPFTLLSRKYLIPQIH